MTKIFGYEWDDISRAQQGGRLHRAIRLTLSICHATVKA